MLLYDNFYLIKKLILQDVQKIRFKNILILQRNNFIGTNIRKM
jgi:hypothetical protein